MDVPPATHGFGLFGSKFGYPEGGLCLSTFLAVHDQQGRLLVGRMDPAHEDRWIERWAPNLAFYEGKRKQRLFEGWRFPATYLRVGEAPRQAAARVWQAQLGFPSDTSLGPVHVSSSAQPSRRSPDAKHWDVLFAYAQPGQSLEGAPEHWTSLRYEDPSKLDGSDGVMLHGQLTEDLAALVPRS